jgi:hypothetical protein
VWVWDEIFWISINGRIPNVGCTYATVFTTFWTDLLTSRNYYILLTVHLVIILVNDQLDAQFFCYTFISILYMFRESSCLSSGESIVSIQLLVCVTLRRWPSSMQIDLHTRRSPTQNDTYQILYWHNWFSWSWARGYSKHVENWHKHIANELCVNLVVYKNWRK